jgi:hypothetical protein
MTVTLDNSYVNPVLWEFDAERLAGEFEAQIDGCIVKTKRL